MDSQSAIALSSLLPGVRAHFSTFYEAANAAAKPLGLSVRFISGTRSYAEQTALYAQGRTAPGKVVTNAKAGYSWHNFSIAADTGVFKGDKYLPESDLYDQLGPIGESCGLEWGGRWKTPDRPHYQFPSHLTLAQMRDRVAAGKSVLA